MYVHTYTYISGGTISIHLFGAYFGLVVCLMRRRKPGPGSPDNKPSPGALMCVCVCVCVRARGHICMYVCSVCMPVCVSYVCVHACMYVCMYVRIYVCMYIDRQIYDSDHEPSPGVLGAALVPPQALYFTNFTTHITNFKTHITNVLHTQITNFRTSTATFLLLYSFYFTYFTCSTQTTTFSL